MCCTEILEQKNKDFPKENRLTDSEIAEMEKVKEYWEPINNRWDSDRDNDLVGFVVSFKRFSRFAVGKGMLSTSVTTLGFTLIPALIQLFIKSYLSRVGA